MPTGIDVRIDGKLLKGVSSYSVEEESTPVDVSDTTGATGRFSVSFFSIAAVAAKRMQRHTVDLEDLGQGTTQGTVRVPARSSQSGQISISADLRTTLLAVTRTAQPYTGTLGGYFAYLLGLVGITSGYVIDPAVGSMPITIPGWRADVWFKVKGVVAVYGAEVALVSDNIVLRPLRGRVTVDKHDASVDWNVDDTSLALSIEGYHYDSQYRVSSLAYPLGGWNEEVQVYQVGAREVVELDIPIEASVVTVDQPVPVDYVDRYHTSSSVYSIMSNDGYPLTAAQWTAAGGKVSVQIGEDTRSLIVTITGADLDVYAPFRIAATAGPSDNYSSLRIVGSGVFYQKTLVTLPTSVSPDIASQEVGATVDNEAIGTLGELFDSLIWTLKRFGGSRQSLTVRTTGVNRAGESGSYAYPTIADFNAQAATAGWADIGDFNTAAGVAGWTDIAAFNAAQLATVSNAFVNQAFGNIGGARTKRDWLWWRIRRATITPGSISYTADEDTVVGDFNEAWTDGGVPATIADFNAQWDGYQFRDFNVAPLERAA